MIIVKDFDKLIKEGQELAERLSIGYQEYPGGPYHGDAEGAEIVQRLVDALAELSKKK